MKNLDVMQKEKSAIIFKINQAVKDGNEEAFGEAFAEFTDLLQEAVLAEARGMVQAADNKILVGRGVRALTSTETKYYEKVIDAMRSNSPQQALTLIDEVLPKTVIDAIFEDITEAHPLLSEINFQNTGVLTEIIVSTLDGRHMAAWGKLCDDITEQLLGGFDTIDLTQNKLSAFIPVCKAMLEIGPEWLDRYVRGILAEAIANGLEDAIINGTGIDQPIGMTRDPNGILDPVTGYAALVPVPVTQITPATYGALIADLATGPNLLSRAVSEVLFICNPVDYFTKIIPAITVRAADGTYVERFPFPTKVIQSVHVTEGTAIIGIGRRYFFGLGTSKGGKIEFSDHYHFLEDERVYLTKLYGDGKPLDSTSFKVLDISALVPVVPKVDIGNWPPVMNVDVTDTGFDATITNDPLNVQGVYDARLASLKIGNKTLTPAFNKSVMVYTLTATDATNTITAVAMDGEATITVKLNTVAMDNGGTATWTGGGAEDVLTVDVTSGTESEQYVVTVTKA